jgi:hypothetical protein
VRALEPLAKARPEPHSTRTIHPLIHPWVDAAECAHADTGGMTFSDYLIDISLIGIVLFQVRGRRLTTKSLLLPVAIVAYVAFSYLKTVPTSGNDLYLVVGCALVGATLGGLAARFTSVRPGADGIPVAKAGLLAAGLWILGTGGRLAFQLYASHGGGSAIAHFSATHAISAATAWTAALILMAISEAVVRTGVLAWRGHAVQRRGSDLVGGVGGADSIGGVPSLVATAGRS